MTGLALVLLAVAAGGAVAVRRGRVGAGPAVVAAVASAGALVLVLLAQLAFVSEGSLPRDDLAGRLPAGLHVTGAEQLCGSGGCWREYTVAAGSGSSGIGTTGVLVAERLRAAGLVGCRHRTWVPDLRRRCTDVVAVGGAARVSTYLTGL